MLQPQTESRLLPQWWRVLNALQKGAKLTIGDAEFELIETEDNCTILAYPLSKAEGNDRYVESDISLNQFINLCNRLREDQIPIVAPKLRREQGE
jgi:hypothetical protein